MGVNVGKGKHDYTDIPAPQKGPRQPVEKPFPISDSFRHGLYVISEELDDYLICKGFDPNAKYPWTHHTIGVRKTIKVAKPPLLMRTPWEGDPTNVRVDGTLRDVTYVYDDDELGKRTASWTISGEEFEEIQRIDPPYFVGDSIMAVEVRQSGGFDGLRVVQGPRPIPGPVTTEAGGKLTWMDLNSGGRKWTRNTDSCPDSMSWDFSTTTSDADPGDYKFRLNNATPASATFIYINDEPLSVIDVGSIIDDLHFGDHVHLSDCDGVSMLFKVSTAVAAIDGTGYWKIPVTHVSGTVLFANGKMVAFKFFAKSGGGQWGKTSGTMTARTTNTALGSGSVILSTGTAGVINQIGGTITAYNGSSASVASGKWVYVVKRQTGEWDLILESCT